MFNNWTPVITKQKTRMGKMHHDVHFVFTWCVVIFIDI